MSITPEAARAQAEAARKAWKDDDPDRSTKLQIIELAVDLDQALRVLLSVFPEPPTTDDRDSRALCSRRSQRC